MKNNCLVKDNLGVYSPAQLSLPLPCSRLRHQMEVLRRVTRTE